MTIKLAARKRLRLENLEGRWLMAGDVTASVIHGSLALVGDDLDNFISVTGSATAGEVVVTGLPDSNGVATKIKDAQGVEHDSLTLEGVTDNIYVNLKGGNDSVSMSALQVAGNVAIREGDGNDTVSLGTPVVTPVVRSLAASAVSTASVQIGGNLDVHLGDGNDTFTESSVDVMKNEWLDAGDGNDSLILGAPVMTVSPTTAATADVNIGKNLGIYLGDGNNTLAENSVDVGKSEYIHAGDGNNVVTLGTSPVAAGVRDARRGLDRRGCVGRRLPGDSSGRRNGLADGRERFRRPFAVCRRRRRCGYDLAHQRDRPE